MSDLEQDYLKELARVADLDVEEMLKPGELDLLTKLGRERLIRELKKAGFWDGGNNAPA